MDKTTYNLVERLQFASRWFKESDCPDEIIELLKEAAERIETLESYIEGV